MTSGQFVNNLRILRSIDKFEVKFLTARQWIKFRDDPYLFMMRADDPTIEKLWAVIGKRHPKVKP